MPEHETENYDEIPTENKNKDIVYYIYLISLELIFPIFYDYHHICKSIRIIQGHDVNKKVGHNNYYILRHQKVCGSVSRWYQGHLYICKVVKLSIKSSGHGKYIIFKKTH